MKKEIIMLILGVFIGAIIATGVFFVLGGRIGENNQREEMPQMNEEFNFEDFQNNGGKMPNFSNDNTTSSSNE